MTKNVYRGVGRGLDLAVYGASPEEVQRFQTVAHDGMTLAVLIHDPNKNDGAPEGAPCFEMRMHRGDCRPGGYPLCPTEGVPGLTAEDVKVIAEACIAVVLAPYEARIAALETSVQTLADQVAAARVSDEEKA